MKKAILIILFMCSMDAFAQSVGKILEVNNKVIAKKGKVQRVLTPGSTIYAGDAIITEANANTKLEYTNGTLVAVQRNSNFKTINYAPEATVKLKASLSKGAIEYSATGKKKGLIQTPVVALAIEGTKFKLISTLKKIYIEVTEGEVKVGDQRIGPSQTFASGSFDQTKTFTPGTIPWETYTGLSAATTQSIQNNVADYITTNFLTLLFDVNSAVIDNVATDSAIDSLIGVPPIAEIIVLGCA